MKIAFIHNNFPSGGAENITINMVKYLSQFPDYQSYIYCMNPREERIDDSLRQAATIKQISTTRNIFIKRYKLTRLIKQDKIDLVIQVGTQTRDIDKIKKSTGVKTILANHGKTFWHEYQIDKKLAKSPSLYKKAIKKYKTTDIQAIAHQMAKDKFMTWYQNSDAYTVLCNDYKNEFEREENINPATSHVYAIENPQEPVAKVNYDKEKIILFSGRLEEEKQVDHLLNIWSHIQDQLNDYKLVIIGNGTLNEELHQLTNQLQLDRVEFKGYVNNPSSYYDKASICCLTSLHEGWPLSLTEAQANGCITIAYNCSAGIEEIISPSEDGTCGFIVTPDDQEEFAATLIKVATMSEEEQLTIRHNAVAKRLKYTPEIQFGKWKQLIDTFNTQSSNN